MSDSSYMPHVRFSVLAVDWKALLSTECWTERFEDAEAIARALRKYDVSVQIDHVHGADPKTRKDRRVNE